MFWLPIDKSHEMPLIRQVYLHMSQRILNGEIKQGERLPSTRQLASNLQVSRNVVLEAYDQLIAEGYIVSKQGSGSYVAEGVQLQKFQREQLMSDILNDKLSDTNKDIIDFRFGFPALELFPRKKWGQLFQQVCSSASLDVFGYGRPEGSFELRQALSRYLIRTRGVCCEPEQVIITTGAFQALYLIAKLLLSAGDQIITEDPLNQNIANIFRDAGAAIYPVPVDAFGIQTNLISVDRKPKFIYITPSHQFPLGGTLPIQRRIELVQLTRQTGCYIIEDNYDNEFRFEGTPVSSLQGLEPEKVIYIGTFSKILSPALRIGYMVVPDALIQKARRLKFLLDHHSPYLDQLVLARFIEEGFFERHIIKMKKIYHNRQKAIIKSLDMYFPAKYKISGHSTGLHLIVEFNNITFTKQILDNLNKAGVRVYPVEMHAIAKGNHLNKVILGYGNVNEEEISKGINRMKKVLELNRFI